MQCPTCQHEVKGRFCPNCGTDMRRALGAAGQQGPGPDPNATSVLSAADLAAYAAGQAASKQSPPGPQPPNQQPPDRGEQQQPPFPGQTVPPPQYGQTTPQQGQTLYGATSPPSQGQPLYGATSSPPGQGQSPLYGATSPPPQGQSPLYGATTPAPQTEYGQQGQVAYAPAAGVATPVATKRRGRSVLKILAAVIGGLIVLAIAGFVALLVFGSHNDGKVKFGTSYKDNGGDFQIQGEKTSFKPSETVTWVGYLNDSVSPSTLTRKMELVNSDGSTKTIVNAPVKIQSASSDKINRIASQSSVADLEVQGITPPGNYQVTYLSSGKKEAQGTFTLTGAPVAGKIFFGTSLTDALVTGLSSKTSFGPNDPFDFVAHFTEPAGAKKLTVKFFFIGTDGSERQVSNSVSDTVGDPKTWVSKNRLTVVKLKDFGVDQNGTYLLRYYRSATQLAEGRFTIQA